MNIEIKKRVKKYMAHTLKSKSASFKNGHKDFLSGKDICFNPYEEISADYDAWEYGFAVTRSFYEKFNVFMQKHI